jgi:hypothetical protein
MNQDIRRQAIVEGVQKGLKPFPKAKASAAALEVAARMWVERGLGLDDFIECAKAYYNEAAGQG